MKEEKKVEYLELIYDLIFVYVIGRSSTLLEISEGGFVSVYAFLSYAVWSLAIIQIWMYSTFYTNMYGLNGIADHVFMFSNMYLLYYLGQGTGSDGEMYALRSRIAWALILLNVCMRYVMVRKIASSGSDEASTVRGLITALSAEALIVTASAFVKGIYGTVLSGAAVITGVIITKALTDSSKVHLVDFRHLSERAMLFVVFTFGEMIIAVSSYFEEGFSFSTVYFSLMCFLIATGLFISYEMLYDHIIYRDMETSGMGYMFIHILMIFSLNLITASLGFMRDESVLLLPKVIMITLSFLLFYGSVVMLLGYARDGMERCRKLITKVIIVSVLFSVLMIVFSSRMQVNILISLLYVVMQLYFLYRFYRKSGSYTKDSETV